MLASKLTASIPKEVSLEEITKTPRQSLGSLRSDGRSGYLQRSLARTGLRGNRLSAGHLPRAGPRS